MTPDERFATLAQQFAGHPNVVGPDPSSRRFGSNTLKVNGSIFAMVTGGRLAVKLPRSRVDELIAAETGLPFDSGKGRPMKEWVALAVDDDQTWSSLAQEAFEFVGSRPKK